MKYCQSEMKPKINRLVQQTHIACNNRETEFPWLNNKTTTMCMSLPGIWRKSRKNTDYIALTLSSKSVVLREKRGWLSPVVGVLLLLLLLLRLCVGRNWNRVESLSPPPGTHVRFHPTDHPSTRSLVMVAMCRFFDCTLWTWTWSRAWFVSLCRSRTKASRAQKRDEWLGDIKWVDG